MFDQVKKELKRITGVIEKWTELDVRYFFRGGIILFSTQALLIISGFLLSVGFARLTDKEFFGQFQFVLAVLGMLSVLNMPGANTAVLLGVSQNKEGTWLQGVKLKAKWSVLGILGLLLTAGYFAAKHDPRYEGLPQIFLIAAIFFPLLYSLDVNHSFFAGRKKFEWSCFFQIITEAGSALAAFIALFFTQSLIIIFAVYLSMQAVGDLLALCLVLKKRKNNKQDSDFKSYSFHLTAINSIPYAKAYFDKLIVTYVLGFQATAVYAIAQAISEQLYAVSKSTSILIIPKLSEHKKNAGYNAIKKHAGKLVLFFTLVAIAGILITPLVIPFFFSDQYSSAVPIAQLLLLVTIPRSVAHVLTRVQEVQKQKKKLYSVNATYATSELVSLIILVPVYGLYGLVGAKAIANTIYVVSAWKKLS